MMKYVEAFERIKAHFQEVQIHQIPREENRRADELAQLASSLIEWIAWDPLYLELATSLAIQSEEEPLEKRKESHLIGRLGWRHI